MATHVQVQSPHQNFSLNWGMYSNFRHFPLTSLLSSEIVVSLSPSPLAPKEGSRPTRAFPPSCRCNVDVIL
jgi:hypothetical protein